jgi:hypothetical protein
LESAAAVEKGVLSRIGGAKIASISLRNKADELIRMNLS